MSLDELAQDPFNVDEFIERLAWRSTQSSLDSTKFEPMVLHGAFCQTIQQLSEYERKLAKKALVLESECIEEEAKQRKKVKDLLRDNQRAFENFQELDERINHVATKVVHLGDQLESVNIPRARNAEALHLMRYLNMYFEEKELNHDQAMFEPSRLHEAAELVQKLHLIAHELPSGDLKFDRAKKRVNQLYETTEKHLMDGFMRAHNNGKIEEMKKMCELLKNFRRYNELIDEFIKENQRFLIDKANLIEAVQELCLTISEVVFQVFFNPENVMTKFVTNIYVDTLKVYITDQLEAAGNNTETYLSTLSKLYASTCQLSNTLADKLKLGADTTFLMKLTKKNLFGIYLDQYFSQEVNYLREKTASSLSKYYESKNHVKRQLQAGGISDLRREVQAKIHINIGPDVDSYSGEVFLSQEVAISILQDFKLAYGRIKTVISSQDLPKSAKQIYDLLVQYLCAEFVDYAIELALYHCPLPESKVPPNLHFFSAVSDTSAIIHLFEKQFNDSLWPIIHRSAQQEECSMSKKQWTEKFELKLDLGLERTLAAVCGYVRHILTTEQKRTDFKPEKADNLTHSQACSSVVSYLATSFSTIKNQLDGKNKENLFLDLGLRLHKVIYEHLLQFQYDSMGAMLAICDINEYRTCIKQLECESVVSLFDVLHALCNLLIVPPDNLRQICIGEPLNQLDKATVYSFIQLRSDYKAERLATIIGR